jgi:ribosomal protein S14
MTDNIDTARTVRDFLRRSSRCRLAGYDDGGFRRFFGMNRQRICTRNNGARQNGAVRFCKHCEFLI